METVSSDEPSAPTSVPLRTCSVKRFIFRSLKKPSSSSVLLGKGTAAARTEEEDFETLVLTIPEVRPTPSFPY